MPDCRRPVTPTTSVQSRWLDLANAAWPRRSGLRASDLAGELCRIRSRRSVFRRQDPWATIERGIRRVAFFVPDPEATTQIRAIVFRRLKVRLAVTPKPLCHCALPSAGLRRDDQVTPASASRPRRAPASRPRAAPCGCSRAHARTSRRPFPPAFRDTASPRRRRTARRPCPSH